jgi:serine/threonine protein kinase
VNALPERSLLLISCCFAWYIVVHDEVEIMHKISHPNCVHLYEMFESPKKIYMVLELLTGGELFDRIVAKGSYSEKEASDLLRSITSAISYLHSINIVHRDLKPENLIYQSQNPDSPIKITDFGLAKFRKEGAGKPEAMTTACGTPVYISTMLCHRTGRQCTQFV